MSDAVKINVVDMIEHEDGSATMHLEMCTQAQAMLIEAGIISLIKNYINEMENGSEETNDV